MNDPSNLTLKKEFNIQKNKIKFKIIEKRKHFFDDKFSATVNDPKKFWSNINTLIYNKNSEKNSFYEIKTDSGQILNERDSVEYFNNYFIDLPVKTIEKEYGDIEKIERNLTSNYSNPNSIFLNAVNEQEIATAIAKLKNSSSTGTDDIKTNIYKKCYASLSKIIPLYINESFLTGKFPDYLKEAKIIPIYKKLGSKQEVANYRPISLLNIISKIFETCIYDRLYSFLESIKFWVYKKIKYNFGMHFLHRQNSKSAQRK